MTVKAPMADRDTSTLEHPFTSFCEAVSDLLDQQAADKGYHRAPAAMSIIDPGRRETAPNPLYLMERI